MVDKIRYSKLPDSEKGYLRCRCCGEYARWTIGYARGRVAPVCSKHITFLRDERLS